MTNSSQQWRFLVPALTCAHCVQAVTAELGALDEVQSVHVDLDSKVVVVTGERLDWPVLEAAVDEAGYELAHE